MIYVTSGKSGSPNVAMRTASAMTYGTTNSPLCRKRRRYSETTTQWALRVYLSSYEPISRCSAYLDDDHHVVVTESIERMEACTQRFGR
jgi:hypothetical protein